MGGSGKPGGVGGRPGGLQWLSHLRAQKGAEGGAGRPLVGSGGSKDFFFHKIELTTCKHKKIKHAVVKFKDRCMKDRKIVTRKIKYVVEDRASLPPGEGKSYLGFGVSARRRLSSRLSFLVALATFARQTFLVATTFCF